MVTICPWANFHMRFHWVKTRVMRAARPCRKPRATLWKTQISGSHFLRHDSPELYRSAVKLNAPGSPMCLLHLAYVGAAQLFPVDSRTTWKTTSGEKPRRASVPESRRAATGSARPASDFARRRATWRAASSWSSVVISPANLAATSAEIPRCCNRCLMAIGPRYAIWVWSATMASARRWSSSSPTSSNRSTSSSTISGGGVSLQQGSPQLRNRTRFAVQQFEGDLARHF